MKKTIRMMMLAVFLSAGIFTSCDDDDEHVEKVKPTITISENGLAKTFNQGDNITLSATLQDNGVLGTLSATLTYKGQDNDEWNHGQVDFKLSGQEVVLENHKLYEIPTDALVGSYTLKITVMDTSGNIAIISEDIVIEKLDEANPVIDLLAPFEAAEYEQGDQITMEGTVTDDKSLKSLRAVVTSDEEGATVLADELLTIDGGTSHEYEDEVLFIIPEDATPGDYTITFTLSDNMDKTTELVRHFVIKQKDRRKPIVQHTMPENNQVYGRGQEIHVITEANDDIAMKEIRFEVTTDVSEGWNPETFVYKTDLPSTGYNGKIFTIPDDAAYGEYLLKIVAIDHMDKESDPVIVHFHVANF